MSNSIKSVILSGLCTLGVALAQPYDKTVDAFFNSKDAFIQGTVIPNIEKYRKSNEQLTFTDAGGQPISGLTVSVKQTEHAFHWGSVPPFQSKMYNTPALFKEWRDIWNFGICESAFKWKANEKTQGKKDWTTADSILNVFTASGAQVELHFLAGYRPDWVDALPNDAAKAAAQKEYALATAEHFKDKITYMQVYNEDLWSHIEGAHVFFDQTPFFSELSKKYPNLHLGINDCWPWNPTAAADVFPSPTVIKAKYPGIKFIAMHGHRPHSYWATPQEVYKLWDPYVGSGVNTQVAEFGIMDEPIAGMKTGAWNDDLRAQFFVQQFSTFFSHPACDGMNMWGMGPDTNRWTANYMIDLQGNIRPSYYAVKSLIRDKFMTKATGSSDVSGIYKYRGFKGTYEVTVTKGSATGSAQVTLGDVDGNTTFKVMDGPGGTLVVQGGDVVNVLPFTPGEKAGQAPDILAQPGEPVMFTGLRDAKTLQVIDMGGRLVREWPVIGERIIWDRKNASGKPVPNGSYAVRAVSLSGKTFSKTLSLN
jgi:GH35 family endo-1,4-beta-xylanase